MVGDGLKRSLRASRFGAACCCVLGGGLVLGSVPASASGEKPQAPITEACGGPATPGAVRLCGTLNPNASAKVGYRFAYNSGPSCTAGNATPGAEVEGQDIAVTGEISGLTPGTEYTYCLVASNPAGETYGQALSFTTPGTPPPQAPITAPVAQSPSQGTTSSEGGTGGTTTPLPQVLATVTLTPASAPAPAPTSTPTPTIKSVTPSPQAQQLANALTACKQKPKRRRASCERLARTRYGPTTGRTKRGRTLRARRAPR